MKKHPGSEWAPVLDRIRAAIHDGGAPPIDKLLGNVHDRRRRRQEQLEKNHSMATGKETAPCSYQKVISRRPVPFQPNPKKNPGYMLVYVEETLECGHTVTIMPSDAEKLIAKRRNCHQCSGWHGALKMPRKRRAA